MRYIIANKVRSVLKRIPMVARLSEVLYPYRDRLRVWWRTNRRKRAYPKDYFERLFEARGDPWQYDSDHQQERLRLLLEAVPEAVHPGLEIGCAEGSFTRLLSTKCRSLVAMDLSLTALRRAKSKIEPSGNVHFVQADLLNLPFRNSFKAIVCAGVLVYFAEKALFEKAAAQICRLLTPNGFLIIENMWERSGGSIEGRYIHDYFRSMPVLHLLRIVQHKEYAISVFQRKIDPVLAAESS